MGCPMCNVRLHLRIWLPVCYVPARERAVEGRAALWAQDCGKTGKGFKHGS